uniref:Uncharacterized protein n=1 Tax=Candidatus Kentrum sp. LFY TaxID=2126342 RepID=A0A450UFM1_9GAMM|nr:MAG: hypothetical protein BECKLFY1418A_GA0070994_101527 [Candidatus Kentron sp. LFY]
MTGLESFRDIRSQARSLRLAHARGKSMRQDSYSIWLFHQDLQAALHRAYGTLQKNGKLPTIFATENHPRENILLDGKDETDMDKNKIQID